MSILNPPEGIALVIQRRLRGADCKASSYVQAEAGRVWLDCSNLRYTLEQKGRCLIDLQGRAQQFPEYDYRVMRTVIYEPPRMASLKGF